VDNSTEGGKLAEARAWLLEALADGQPHSAGELQERARRVGIATRTLRHVAGPLGVQITPIYAPGHKGYAGWLWALPQRQEAR
jgi:hypothetical protein